jgi:predicted alpha/beta-hydrolase family hydrolase
VLEAAGERIRLASALLANELGHIESESAEHDLHCFQAIRRMDEISLLALTGGEVARSFRWSFRHGLLHMPG